MSLSSLPIEILVKILSWMNGRDIISARLTCKSVYSASHVSNLWKIVCEREYNVKKEHIGSLSFEDFYSKVLHHYGKFLGLWRMQIEHYGGFVSLKVDDGAIIATQLLPPLDPEVWMPFKRKELFKISVNPEGKTALLCTKGPEEPHKIKVIKGNSPSAFSVQCKQPHSIKQERQQGFADWIHNELGMPHGNGNIEGYQLELLRIKYFCLQQYDSSCSFTSLPSILSSRDAPIQPGFFKGTYGGHGIEVIQLTHEGNRLIGTKVTGDPNVPAGKESIIVHLDEPLLLNRDQQRDLNTLKEITTAHSEGSSAQKKVGTPEQQPFSVPFGVEDRGFIQLCNKKDIPTDYCTARFCGTGLIAMHGFRSSSRTDCHFVIFSEDVFAFLWMELGSLSVYSRADDFL